MDSRKEKYIFYLCKALSVILLAYLLFTCCALFLGDDVSLLFINCLPLAVCMIMCLGASLGASVILGVALFVLHFVVPVMLGFLSHLAYFKRKLWMNGIVYLALAVDMGFNLLLFRWLAVPLDIVLILLVKFMIPFWASRKDDNT